MQKIAGRIHYSTTGLLQPADYHDLSHRKLLKEDSLIINSKVG
jgi:hypothetical protein